MSWDIQVLYFVNKGFLDLVGRFRILDERTEEGDLSFFP